MIRTLARKEFLSLFAAPSAWAILALLQFILSWFYLARLDDYLQVQAQLAQMGAAPGATISVAAPLNGALALMLMVLIPLFTMRLIAEERRNGTWVMLVTAPISATSIVLGKFSGLLLMLTLVVAASTLLVATLALGTRIDAGLVSSNLLGLWLLAACYAALGLFFSALSRQPIAAAMGAMAVSFGLWMLDMGSEKVRALSPNAHFQNLNVGLVSSADIAYFALFTAFFLALTIRLVRHERGGR